MKANNYLKLKCILESNLIWYNKYIFCSRKIRLLILSFIRVARYSTNTLGIHILKMAKITQEKKVLFFISSYFKNVYTSKLVIGIVNPDEKISICTDVISVQKATNFFILITMTSVNQILIHFLNYLFHYM